MRCNVGSVERAIRLVLGIVLLALAVSSDLPLWGKGLCYLFGIVSLVTSAFGVCPVWKMLGIDTCSMPGPKR